MLNKSMIKTGNPYNLPTPLPVSITPHFSPLFWMFITHTPDFKEEPSCLLEKTTHSNILAWEIPWTVAILGYSHKSQTWLGDETITTTTLLVYFFSESLFRKCIFFFEGRCYWFVFVFSYLYFSGSSFDKYSRKLTLLLWVIPVLWDIIWMFQNVKAAIVLPLYPNVSLGITCYILIKIMSFFFFFCLISKLAFTLLF